MKKHTNKPISLIFLILLSTSIFANKTPNYPKGFSPKTNSSISFTENKGQIHDQNYKLRPDVLFGGSDGNLVFHLKNNGISYQLNRVDTWKKEEDLSTKKAGFENAEAQTKLVADQRTIYRLDINWLNANTNAELTKQNPLDGFNNYYLENCPNGALNVKSYQQITYQNIYDGIDLKWYEKDGRLEYDYLVSAGADYKQIQLEIKGADKITLNNKGELIYKTPLGDIIEQAPLVKQNGKTLKSKWIIKNNVLSFEIENINKSQAFIIDPLVRTWGTYYGGSGDDIGYSCTTDASGNVYMAGYTNTSPGTSIATSGSHQSAIGGSSDAFVVKFNSAGIRQWGTYYGGSGYEEGNSCATDASGNVYMAGYTQSSGGIATAGSHQSARGGTGQNFDAFLVKFNSAGIRQWGTYYGGSGDDYGYSCTTDASGNVYMAGYTDTSPGTSIATAGSHQSARGGTGQNFDAFLVKFNAAGIRQWGTYYGGSGDDYGYSCTTDANGNVYMAGYTYTSPGTSIATAGSHQSAIGGSYDAFLVKFNSAGIRQWGTYYGGSGDDYGYSCTTDASGNVYMAGWTDTNSGTSIATAGSHQSAHGGGFYDAFLVKFIDCVSPTISVNSGAICAGQSFTINPTGANTYTIQGGSAVVSPSINTTYTVIGTNTAGCVSQAFATSSLIVNASPIITVNNGTICAGQSFTINPTGANTYTIQGGSAVVSPSINTTYTVIGTNTAGCVSQAFATSSLIVNASPIITVNNGTICVGQNFTINPNGANTYTIQGGNAVVSPPSNSSYTVIGKSTAGCVSQGFATSSLTVNLCVGITNQNMGLGGVAIYPNPTNGEFTIELVSVNNTYITITNVLGQIIKTQKAELINQINLNLFEKGVYFISVMDNNQSVYRGSIIKE